MDYPMFICGLVLLFIGKANYDESRKKLLTMGCLWHALMSGICLGLAIAAFAIVVKDLI